MTKRPLVSLALSLLTVTAVHADDARVDEADAPEPAAPASRLTLPAGKIALAVALQSDLTSKAAGDAVSLAPDLAYGVTNRFTVALVHTTRGGSGFWSGLGTGSLCIMGERCADTYSTGALLSKLDLFHHAKLDLAALGGVIYNVDPFRVGVGLGAEALVQAGPVAVHFKPTIYIGVNERAGETLDDGTMIGPNKEFLNLPLALLVPATKHLQLGVQSGVAAPVDGFAKAYRVPVAVMGTVALGAWSAGLALSFDRVMGGDHGMPAPGALDKRSLTLSLGYVR
ncbi:MAG: hypothetical protein M4D80_35835 [Myxococcota bacterium]|nr:hypothetical protein [Deltaproteobacteria bacterium]MDQ3340560.1 hypothetical protein [Myxococcota bacterium]